MCVLRPRNFCGTSLPSALSRTPRKGSFPLFCSFPSSLAGNLCLLKIVLWKSLTILFSLWPDRTSVHFSTCFSITQPSWARCPKAFSPTFNQSRQSPAWAVWEGRTARKPASQAWKWMEPSKGTAIWLQLPTLRDGLFLGKSVQRTKQLVERVKWAW